VDHLLPTATVHSLTRQPVTRPLTTYGSVWANCSTALRSATPAINQGIESQTQDANTHTQAVGRTKNKHSAFMRWVECTAKNQLTFGVSGVGELQVGSAVRGSLLQNILSMKRGGEGRQ
jgi:hypothetical protein